MYHQVGTDIISYSLTATHHYSLLRSEALKYSGALDYVSEENMDTAQEDKASVQKTIDKYREGVRNRFKPESL